MRLKKLFFPVLSILLVVVGIYAGLLWQNNRSVAPVSKAEIQQSLSVGIAWLLEHKGKILKESNPMLWWMVQQSAIASGDPGLYKLFASYETVYLKNRRNNIWRPLFYENTWSPVDYETIRQFPYYNKHFLYALNCDRDLEKYPEIRTQNEADFCNSHPLRPACVTHQLMGIRMLQRKKCGVPDELDNTVSILQQRIRNQLFYDPRVVDVYIQRVLMLIESGSADTLKPVWLRQVLRAQSEAGGWSNFDPLLALPGGWSLGFSQRGIGIQKQRDTFHATAQGVMVMSLLSNSMRSSRLERN